ncbi:MAG: NAD(P)H-hydrate dehydratase, partial [Bryobacteraceae bacterium]
IGSPPSLFEDDLSITLALIEPLLFRRLVAARPRGSHKGNFGHVLVIGGAPGKTGAAAMAGIAALRAGAGLVTVACVDSSLTTVAPELMSGVFPGNAEGKDVLAVGPGLGTDSTAVELVDRGFREWAQPAVIDADGLNALARLDWCGGKALRVLTPHPGEMARLTGRSTREVQAERVESARGLATSREVCVVLKGQRTLIAFPDGRVWINPTGSPAMATGGSGDILTGLIAGMLAQFPDRSEQAIAAAVYLHGLAGEIGAARLGEQALIATDLLKFLPDAIHAAAHD